MDELDRAYEELVASQKPEDELDKAYEEFVSPQEKQFFSKPGVLESTLLGLQKGATAGFSKPIASGSVISALSGPAALSPLFPRELTELKEEKGYELANEAQKQLKLREEQAAKEHGISYGAGNLLGGMSTGQLIPGSGVKQLAIGGGLAGLGESESPTLLGKAKDTVIGAGGAIALGKPLGYIAEKASPYLSKGMNAIADYLEKKAAKTRVEALKPPPTFLEKLEKKGQLEKAGQFLKEKDIQGTFTPYEKEAQKFEAIKDKIGSELGEIADSISSAQVLTDKAGKPINFRISGQDISNDLDYVLEHYRQQPFGSQKDMAEYMLKEYGDFLQPDKEFTIKDLNNYKTEIGKKIGKDNANVEADINMYHYLAQKVDDSFEKVVQEVDPAKQSGILDRYKALLKDYTTAKALQPSMERYVSKKTSQSDIFLKDIATAKIAMDLSHGNPYSAIIAAGGALASKAARSSGDILKASTMEGISSLLKTNPQALGQYSNLLSQAAARSPDALSAYHYTLYTSDPNYRDTIHEAIGMNPNEE